MLVRLDGRCPALRPSLLVVDDGHEVMTFDAADLLWASPADLTGLVSWAAATKPPKRLVLPSDVDAGSYLRRMDLLQLLDQYDTSIIGELPPEERQPLGHRLIEIHALDGPQAIEKFVSSVFDLVEANVGQRQAVAVHRMLGELLDNIPHAQSPVGAFGAAQVYSGRKSGDPGIQVSVADPGRGVLASLQDNPVNRDIPDCASAIRAALREGVSGEQVPSRPDAPVRGVGLTEVVRRLQDHEGLLLLRSGSGLGRITFRSRHFRTTETSTPGTWAWLHLKTTNSHAEHKT